MSLIMNQFRSAMTMPCSWKTGSSFLAISTQKLPTNYRNQSTGFEPGPLSKFEPVRQVFISQSNDIFTNLALEDWLYQHHDFAHKHLLLLWRNDPCVVIGRHQNPWTESNVPYIRNSSVNLARRNSGGGTVYHDLGNINCTFFTQKSEYRRKHNLEIICSAIRRLSNLDVKINGREDIVLNNEHKISGTAAKLGKDTAYHHCTVLVNVNQCQLHESLDSKSEGVESRATQSVRVPVQNLKQVMPSLTEEDIQEAVGWEFLRTTSIGNDVGMEQARSQRGFTMIRPDDFWFPGIEKLKEDLKSNEWIFGKTPQFTVRRCFPLTPELAQDVDLPRQEIELELTVKKGVISKVRVLHPVDFLSADLSEIFHGLNFNQHLPENVLRLLEANVDDSQFSLQKKIFLVNCIHDTVKKFA